MNKSVSLFTEIPEDLHQSLKKYLDAHPTWDQDRVFTTALFLFLSLDKKKNYQKN